MIKLGSNSIGKIYLGSNSIGKAYLGSNLVFQKGSSPTPATMIPYIRGGAGSYIDTGITPDNTTKVIVWARNVNPNSAFIFGSRVAYGDSAFYITANSGTNSCRMSMTYGNADSVYPTTGTHEAYLSSYHKYEMDGANLYVDDALIATSTGTFSGNNHNIHLFGLNDNGNHSPMSFPADICACKIYKNGTLVRDFTAVNTPSVGLYDAVSDTVFTNAGSGSFTYGTFNSNAYTPLEYIYTSGASAFITPAIGSYSLTIVIKFHPTGTDATWYMPLGARSQDVKRCDIITGNTTYSNCRLYSLLGDGEGSTTIYSSSTTGAVRKDLVVVKYNNTFSAYYDNAAFGSAATFNVSASYSTGARIGVGAQLLDYPDNPHFGSYFVGNIYYVGLGAYNLVPAKVSGVAGMYDTYNDFFYPSTTSTPFTAGPEL